MQRQLAGVLIVAWTLLQAGCVKREDIQRSASGQPTSSPSEVETIGITTKSGIEMTLIPGGEFMMGTSDGSPDETPVHKVHVSPIAMDRFEVTQQQFAALELPDPSQFKDESGKRPMEQVRWSDAAKYCNQRSRQEGLEPCYDEDDLDFKCNFEAGGYRLPTEAEMGICRACGNRDRL